MHLVISSSQPGMGLMQAFFGHYIPTYGALQVVISYNSSTKTHCSPERNHIRLTMIPMQLVMTRRQVAMSQYPPVSWSLQVAMTSFQLASRKIQQDTTKIQLAKTPCSSEMSHIRVAMVTIQLVAIKRQVVMPNTYLSPGHCRLKMSSIQFAM